jgi:hypothetical protein
MFLSMIAMTIAILVGHYSGRNPNTGILESLVVSAIVIPFAIAIIALPLYNLVTLYDWPNNAYVLPPPIAIWGAAMLGGFLGVKSGMIWNQGEASCFHCLVSFGSVLAVLSLVVVLFL